MNLGAFAGGLAQGYQAGERMNMAREELENSRNFRERQMKIAEERQQWESMDRQKKDAMTQEHQNLFSSFYNEENRPGQDPAKDFRFTVESMAVGMKYGSVDPASLLKVNEYVKQMTETEQGKKFFAAMSGDQNAMSELATASGLDPAKIRFGKDSNGRAIFTDGAKTVDVSQQAMWLAGAKAFEMIEGINKSERESRTAAADIGYKNAATTAQLASAGNQSASAEQTRVETKNLRETGAKDPGARKTDNVKVATDFLSKNELFKMQRPSDQQAVNRYVEYLVTEKGARPSDAVYTALAELEKRQTKGSK